MKSSVRVALAVLLAFCGAAAVLAGVWMLLGFAGILVVAGCVLLGCGLFAVNVDGEVR